MKQWFLKNLKGLKRIEAGGDMPTVNVSPFLNATNKGFPPLYRNRIPLHPPYKRISNVFLPSVWSNQSQFDTLLSSYESLAQTILFTIRLELRCHVIYFLDHAIKEGNFGLTQDELEDEDLDPSMISLCKDLVSFEDLLSTTLQSTEYRYRSPLLLNLPPPSLLTVVSCYLVSRH